MWPFNRKPVVTEPALSPFVPLHYQMNPETEDLLFSGWKLKTGMVVLIEDSILRQNVANFSEDTSSYDLERALENNRWATVSEIEFRSDIVRFVATYEDGSKKIRRYNVSYGWLVKLDSLVTESAESQV